jgi:rare lipoprotein A
MRPAARFPQPRWARAGLACVALLLGACASHPARYYANDGPPDHVPADIASTPDAVPRVEPIHPFANRPYAALGRNYTPDTGDAPFEQRGMASWYGRQYQGNRTASGESYDMFAMSAAHPTLPIPSYARVTSVRDGRSVVVRINDRGPFLQNRVIDLSYAAAVRLNIANSGSGEVIVHKITNQEIAAAAPAAQAQPVLARTAEPAPAPEAPGAETAPVAEPAPVAGAALLTPLSAAAVAVPPAAVLAAAAPDAQPPPPAGAEASPPASPEPAAASAAPPADARAEPLPLWSVQLGAFGVAANAGALRDEIAQRLAGPLAEALSENLRAVRLETAGSLTRVLIGHLPDRRAAQALALRLQKLLGRDAIPYRTY